MIVTKLFIDSILIKIILIHIYNKKIKIMNNIIKY